ncbi:ATP-binding protein [Nitrospirota bacterium]
MRNKIISSLFILFTLFTAGSALTMLYLYNTTSNLRSVIDLHRVEIIRQDLVINAQTVQSHLYAFGTAFGHELDVIVDNVIDLDDSARKCLSCHHDKEMTQKLKQMISQVEQYQDALSHLITTSANIERVERLKIVAIGIGSVLLDQVQEMALIAGQKLNDKSISSLKEINNSRVILIITLILSFFIAVIIAVTMTRQVTEPIYELLDATRHIKAGELGYTTHYVATGEFKELIDSFNDMSLTLDESNSKIMKHLNNLSNLYSITLSFHSITDESEIFRELAYGAAELVGADQCGLLLLQGDEFIHTYPALGLDRQAAKMFKVPKETISELYSSDSRRAYIINSDLESSPLGSLSSQLYVRNMMLVWIRQRGEVVGAIRVANKRSGDFSQDDVQPIAILANNVLVATENARLYADLKRRMQELQETQQQLVQTAKLAAIGELASNIAHELNNPLTSVLGYTQLIKEEDDLTNIGADLDVIEKECRRAKDIIRQLLEFARSRPLRIKTMDINASLSYVLELVRVQVRKNSIEIVTDFAPDTTIKGDENQLKQVFINIVNNAVQSMEHSGKLSITTHPADSNIIIKISDSGSGMPKDIIGKIFEPFFTTKKDKGTGVGLSVSYKIIKSHSGSIDVESTPGKGTTFTITLPRDTKITDELPASA